MSVRLICDSCGSANRPGDKYCTVCGAVLRGNSFSIDDDREEDGEYDEKPKEVPKKNEAVRDVLPTECDNPGKKPLRGPYNKITALILCLFFGVWGIHKFYEGKILMGVFYIFSCGFFGIGVFIDLIVILCRPKEYYL